MKRNLVIVLAISIATAGGYLACKKEAERPPEPKAPTSGKGGGTAAPVAAGGYQTAASLDDAGKITGTVKYTGDKKDGKVKVTKDKGTCCPKCTAGERPAHTLVVNDGKLKNAVVYIDGIKKGKKLEKKDVALDNKDCAFDPHVAIGYKGAKVVAKNSDPVLHNTHLFLKKNSKDLVNIALPNQGQEVGKKLKKSGIISVKCDAHEWMQGYIYAAETPYATLTDENGSFSLDEVPPGDYTVKVWHERLGEKELKVKVAAKGEAKADVTYE